MARIAMLRVALGLARMTFGEILTLAGAVLTGMTGNSIYPNPPVDMETFKLAVEALAQALADSLDGSKSSIRARNEQARTISRMLRQLAHYVESHCENDEAKLRSSGFQPLYPVKNVPLPLSKSIRRIEFGPASGSLKITLVADPEAGHYELQYARCQADGVLTGEYSMLPIVVSRPPTLLKELAAATYYSLRVRTLRASGFTAWSDPVVFLCR
jgi:hypothetical protein